MTDLPADSTQDIALRPVGKRQRSRRRSVMMQWLAAGVGAGLISGLGTRSVQATNGDPVTVGSTYDGTLPTAIRNSASSTTPDTTADGLQGYAAGANNSGLLGRNSKTGGIGVTGAAPSGTGVFGESSNGYGVGGRSSSSYGVYGDSASESGVYAQSAAAYSPTKAAVYGKNINSGIGVRAESAGVALYAASTGNIALYSQASGPSATAVYGDATGSGARAAAFVGNVDISGSLTVTGSYPKSAVGSFQLDRR